MQEPRNPSNPPSTGKAIGVALLLVGGYWLLFGAVTVLIMRPTEQTVVAQHLPRPDRLGRAVAPGVSLASVSVSDYTLKPMGRPMRLDESKLEFVGQTNEGYGLWTERPTGGARSRGGGGGGGGADIYGTPLAVPAATGPLYLRTTDHRWWHVLKTR
jgi:hypothetical protein